MLMTEVITNGIAGSETLHSKEAAQDAVGVGNYYCCCHAFTNVLIRPSPGPYVPLLEITLGRCHL